MQDEFLESTKVGSTGHKAITMPSPPVTEATGLQLDGLSAEGHRPVQQDDTVGCQATVSEPIAPAVTTAGVTLAGLAEALRLPQAFLQELGLTEQKKDNQPAIRIPYLDHQGNTLAVRWLLGIKDQKGKFVRRQGDKPTIYGLWNLEEYLQCDVEEVLLANDLFDFWVCEHRNLPVLCLPEGNVWRDEWNQYLDWPKAVLIWEKDAGVFVPKLSPVVHNIEILRLPDNVQTLTTAHLSGADLFNLIAKCASQAVSVLQLRKDEANAQIGKLKEEAASIIMAPDPIQVVREAIRDLGYGGDLNPPLITYLALTSRVLAMRPGTMPVHVALVGQPSSGKSYCLLVVLKMIPPEVYNKIDAGSPKVFIYDDFDYEHGVAIFSEAHSLPAGEDNPAASAIRNMLQDHHLHYKVTERDPETGKFVVREIERPGPTVLVTTAVKRLGHQLDTRLFSLEVPDDLEQIRAALAKQADIEITGIKDPDPALIAYQAYLQAQAPWHVAVPFSDRLAHEIGRLPHASRINRDFARLISLIKSVTVLRHEQRQRDEKERLIAEVDDYALVYELVGKMYETTVTRVSDKIRNIIRAVEELRQQFEKPVSTTKVAQHLGCTKQALSQAVKEALKQGWLVNQETKRGHPYDLEVGEPLPEALGLPTPDSLREDLEEAWETRVSDVCEFQAVDDPGSTSGSQGAQSVADNTW